MKIFIGIVDCHPLFSKSLALMINSFKDFKVVFLAIDSIDLQEKIKQQGAPDIILINNIGAFADDGTVVAQWLNQNHPTIKLAALSMCVNEQVIIDMIKAGCCAYMMMDSEPEELENGLRQIHMKGFYNSDAIGVNYRRLLLADNGVTFSAREKTFLNYACTDLTYKEIAAAMNLSERTIDGYRECLFHKFKVQSRVGLAIAAIKKNLIKI